jgi:hypothetical protein
MGLPPAGQGAAGRIVVYVAVDNLGLYAGGAQGADKRAGVAVFF